MEVLTVSEMTLAEQAAMSNGTDGFALMQRAGRAVADVAADMLTGAAAGLAGGTSVLVVAGRGNNGGDGFIAATELAARGFDVSVMLLCERGTLKGDAARAAAAWGGSVVPSDPGAIGAPNLIIDALFGAGLNRVVKGDPLAMIAAINASAAPVLSVDLPSGIAGDSGEVLGDAVRATRTVTFFRRKPAHLLLPGRLHCGEADVVDIGIGGDVLESIQPRTFENVPDLWSDAFPVPRIDGHKYARGHAVVVSGDVASTGAARLAAMAALRGGAGLVTLASPRDALAVNAAALTAVMVRPVDTHAQFAELLSDRRLNACVIGPGAGIGERTRGFVQAALSAKRGLVLDADALTSFSDNPIELFDAMKNIDNPQVVLTPHDGEFAKLFSALSANTNVRSKLERVRAAARMSGAVVLLKGADSVVASPDGRATISANAPPWLATAGSGDVLAGLICAMLAQSVPAFEAACMGVWMHGEAAQHFGPGLIAEDLPEMLPTVFRDLYDAMNVKRS